MFFIKPVSNLNYDLKKIILSLLVWNILEFGKNGLSTSASSSGFYSNQSERSDPSPPAPSHLSESAPATTGMVFGPFQQDDGIDVDDAKLDGTANGSPKQVCFVFDSMILMPFLARFQLLSGIYLSYLCTRVLSRVIINFLVIFMPPDQVIEDILFWSLSICLSAHQSVNFNL